jgi:O-antigen ligase
VNEFTSIDILASFQIVLVILSLFLILLFTYKQQVLKKISKTSISMLIAYYLFSAFSSFWSPLPIYSLFRAVEYLTQIFIVIIIVWKCEKFDYAEHSMLCLSFFVILLGISMMVRLRGFSTDLSHWHANHYTVAASMIFCYCFGEYLGNSQKRLRRLQRYGFGGLVCLILGTSAASFMATGAGVIVAIFLSKQGRSIFTYLIVTVGAVTGLIMLAPQVEDPASWVEFGQQLKIYSSYSVDGPTLSLHGRITLWEQYIEEIKQSPLYGHGFAISSRLARFYTTNTHNGLLAALLGTGLIGFGLVVWGGCRLVREMRSAIQARQIGALGCAAALTAGLVNNLSISIVGEQWREPSFVLVTILSFHLLFVFKQQEAVSGSPRDMHRVPMVTFSPPRFAGRAQPRRRVMVGRGVVRHS